MKEVIKTMYQADDGTAFDTAKECEKYEADLADRAKRTTYWHIHFAPDVTEGRGMQQMMFVECYGPIGSDARMFMEDWCHRNMGRPIAFVQGVSPMPGWILAPSTVDQFRQDRGKNGWGSAPTRRRLIVGPRESGLVDDDTKTGSAK